MKHYGNCLIYVIIMRITQGGKIKWSKSRTWFGFHTTWIDNTGTEWEYTLNKPKKHPWWYIPIFYTGTVKRRKL